MTVTAAPEQQARLLDLQALDDELSRVAAHRKRLTTAAELTSAQAAASGVRRERGDRLGTVEDLRTRVRRLETDGALVAQRLDRDRSRLAATSSPRDAQGLEQEIATLLRRREALDDEELELMEQLEAAEASLAASNAALADAEQHVARLTGDRDEALAGLADRERQVSADRGALAVDLPADLVALYDRQRTRYGVGAALLTRGISGGSNMALTGADLAAVRAAAPEAVVLDPESGCILVRTAESGL